MVGELMAGAGAFKSMFDMAKALKEISDAVSRNEVAIKLQGLILDAQQDQATLIERIRELEKRVAAFETWEAEKQRYELKRLETGSFAYALKDDMRGTEPPHYICAACYQKGQKAIFHELAGEDGYVIFHCSGCDATVYHTIPRNYR